MVVQNGDFHPMRSQSVKKSPKELKFKLRVTEISSVSKMCWSKPGGYIIRSDFIPHSFLVFGMLQIPLKSHPNNSLPSVVRRWTSQNARNDSKGEKNNRPHQMFQDASATTTCNPFSIYGMPTQRQTAVLMLKTWIIDVLKQQDLVGGTTCLKLIVYLNWKHLSKYQEDTNSLVVSIAHQIGSNFSKFWGENKIYMKPPPS